MILDQLNQIEDGSTTIGGSATLLKHVYDTGAQASEISGGNVAGVAFTNSGADVAAATLEVVQSDDPTGASPEVIASGTGAFPAGKTIFVPIGKGAQTKRYVGAQATGSGAVVKAWIIPASAAENYRAYNSGFTVA